MNMANGAVTKKVGHLPCIKIYVFEKRLKSIKFKQFTSKLESQSLITFETLKL